MTDLLLAAVLVAAGLLGRALLTDPRRVPRERPPTPGVSTVSIVVPARNEASTLPLLLASLGRLTTRPREVLVVDDRSEDGTAEIARVGGATVVAGSGPPPGWTGKAWACHEGATAATGSRLLFLDADTVLAPDALNGLLALHDHHGGLVSVQPHHDARHGYEQLSAYFNIMSVLASGAFTRRRLRRPMAFGPTLFTSREDYVRAGGHSAVRGEVLDDVQLAAVYSRNGLPVTCFLGGSTVRMRMYAGGPAQLAEGWTKNIASGAGAADRLCSLTAGLWLASHWAVAVSVGLVVVTAVTRHAWPGEGQVPSVVGHPLLWVAAWLGVSLQLRAMLRRVGSFRWWAWAVFPVPLLAFSVLFVRSGVLTSVRHEVRWRGRSIGTHRTSPKEIS